MVAIVALLYRASASYNSIYSRLRVRLLPQGSPCARPSLLVCPFMAQCHRARTCCALQLAWRLSDEPPDPHRSDEFNEPLFRARTRAKIFLGFTSNMISSGVREVLRYLAQHRMVDVMVTTGGAVEEDVMKTLAPAVIGDFGLDGAALRSKGINRIGNTVVPNANYCKFEEWLAPLLERMYEEQERDGVNWTPSKVGLWAWRRRLGLVSGVWAISSSYDCAIGYG